MPPIVTDRVAWSVCLSISRSATILSTAKTAELIEMSSVKWTRVGRRNHVHIRHAKGQFWMTNCLLKKQDQQFIHNRIRALRKCWTECISVTGNCVKKRQNTTHISCHQLSQSTKFLNAPVWLHTYKVDHCVWLPPLQNAQTKLHSFWQTSVLFHP